MKMLFYSFVVIVSCMVVADYADAASSGKHLPNYVVPCSKSSPELNACALEHGRKAIPSLLKGDKKFRIPVLSPFKLDKVEIRPGNSFELILTNIILHGIENLELKELTIEEGKRHAKAILVGNGIRLLSDYKVGGQILILPISGNGKADFQFDDCLFKYTIDYEIVKGEDGKEYGKVKHSDVWFDIKKAKFQLDNLFNGNKELGDNMNVVLNENHEAVLKDLGGAISKIVDTIATGILSSFLGVIPYEEIFLP